MRFRNHHVASRLTGAFLVVLTLIGCADEAKQEGAITQEIAFRPDGILDFKRADSTLVTRIVIEIAETAQAQAQGRMYRRSMPQRGGMLFVNQAESMRSFWMKNTSLSLDILFVDAEGEIINIVKETAPFSEEYIESTEPAQLIVEVRSGFVDLYGITENDRITWERRTFEESDS